MENYIHVGTIIEKERLARKERISKAITSDKCENIGNDIQKSVVDNLNDDIKKDNLLPEVLDFKKSIEEQNLSKADTDIYLHKVQRELSVNSNSLKLNQIKRVLINHRSSLV